MTLTPTQLLSKLLTQGQGEGITSIKIIVTIQPSITLFSLVPSGTGTNLILTSQELLHWTSSVLTWANHPAQVTGSNV